MRSASVVRRAALATLASLLVAAAAWTAPAGASASRSTSTGHATVAGSLVGEGGDTMGPVMDKLLHDDAPGLSPDLGSYTNVDINQGIADFVGSSPGTFANDFAVTERPLTSAEAATAKANGRTYAYVPYAASPVALMTLVPVSTAQTANSIEWDQMCQHIPLSLTQLDGIYGSPAYSGWGDSNLTCSTPDSTDCTAPPATGTSLLSGSFIPWANLDPTMENDALMTLLDSTPASQAAFQAALTTAVTDQKSSTSNPAPSESWPYTGSATPAGDQATLTKLVGLNSQTELPSTVPSLITLGAIMAIASDWTGAPLGEQWNLPTAAVQNAQGSYVWPCVASAEAAESDATLASTTDPTTDNIVTFNTNDTSDAAAYNGDLMLESYLVVPLNGLPADKATALAQFIRFIVGGTGQADIESLGAAPATKAMTTADLAVAQELNAEAASAASSTSSSSSSSSTTTTTAAGSTTSTTPGSTTGNTGTLATGAAAGTPGSGGLAFTGDDPLPLLVLGAVLLVFGETARRVVRRRRRIRA